jgi:CheY-like chemotaxis protein
MSILVAESNEHVRDVLAVILEAEGYEVAVASSWLEALHTLRRRADVELVLADLMMPFLSTWALDRMVGTDADVLSVRVVMMTGGLSASPSPEGMPVLRKPFDMKQLLEVVRQELALPRRTRVRASQPVRRASVRKTQRSLRTA